MDKITVRDADLADAPIVYEFINELENAQFDAELFNQYFARNLTANNVYYLVAAENEQVVGFLSCHGQMLLHHMGLVYEIQELFVHKDYRSKGIGAIMINALKLRIQEQDYKLLEVCCNVRRTRAHQFYIANGSQQTHYKFTQVHPVDHWKV